MSLFNLWLLSPPTGHTELGFRQIPSLQVTERGTGVILRGDPSLVSYSYIGTDRPWDGKWSFSFYSTRLLSWRSLKRSRIDSQLEGLMDPSALCGSSPQSWGLSRAPLGQPCRRSLAKTPPACTQPSCFCLFSSSRQPSLVGLAFSATPKDTNI